MIRTINRSWLVWEWLLDNSWNDTNDGTKNNSTLSNVTFANTDVWMQYKYGTFNGSSSKWSGWYTNLNFERTNSFSVFAWVYASSTSSNAMIICQQASASTYQWWNLRLDSSGVISCNLTSNYPTNNYLEARATDTLSTWKWYFVGYTYSGNSNTSGINFYINWKQSATISNFNNLSASIQNTNNVTIGSRNSESLYLNWNLQTIRVFNRIISESEIYTLFLEWKKKLSGESYSGLMDGLVAYYDMKGDANDVVGGKNGTVTNATLTTDRFWNTNNAYSFNWTSAYNYASSNLGINNWDMTFSFWIKPTSEISSWEWNFIQISDSSTQTSKRVWYQYNWWTRRIYWLTERSWYSGEYTAYNTSLWTGWVHIVCVKIWNTLNMYLWWQLVGTTSITSGGWSGSWKSWFSFWCWFDATNPTYRNYFPWIMSCALVFSRWLSASEALQLSQITSLKPNVYPF